MTHTVALTVRTENYVPPDVLVEHLAVAMQALHFTGKIDIIVNSVYSETKAHPFDGPEVFDDSPQLEEYSGPKPEEPKYATGGYTGKPGTSVHDVGLAMDYYTPVGIVHKGEYHLPGQMLRDAGIVDPYPNVTRALDSLRASRTEADNG